MISYGKYVDVLKDCMQRRHDTDRKYLGKNSVRMKDSYDHKQSLTHYKPDDLILYGTKSCQVDVVPKIRVNFQGPYLVRS